MMLSDSQFLENLLAKVRIGMESLKVTVAYNVLIM